MINRMLVLTMLIALTMPVAYGELDIVGRNTTGAINLGPVTNACLCSQAGGGGNFTNVAFTNQTNLFTATQNIIGNLVATGNVTSISNFIVGNGRFLTNLPDPDWTNVAFVNKSNNFVTGQSFNRTVIINAEETHIGLQIDGEVSDGVIIQGYADTSAVVNSLGFATQTVFSPSLAGRAYMSGFAMATIINGTQNITDFVGFDSTASTRATASFSYSNILNQLINYRVLTLWQSGNATDVYGYLYKTPIKTGGFWQNEYAIYIEDVNNSEGDAYAIYTNKGKVRLGDNVTAPNINVSDMVSVGEMPVTRTMFISNKTVEVPVSNWNVEQSSIRTDSGKGTLTVPANFCRSGRTISIESLADYTSSGNLVGSEIAHYLYVNQTQVFFSNLSIVTTTNNPKTRTFDFKITCMDDYTVGQGNLLVSSNVWSMQATTTAIQNQFNNLNEREFTINMSLPFELNLTHRWRNNSACASCHLNFTSTIIRVDG